MKAVRLALYYLVGLLLGAVSVLSYAQTTIPATQNGVNTMTAAGVGQYYGYNLTDSTFSGYCAKALAANGGYPKGACPDLDPATTADKSGYCGRFFANSYCSNPQANYQTVCPTNYAMVNGVCKNSVPIYTCPQGYTGPTTENGQQVCKAKIQCNYSSGGNQTPNEAGTECVCNLSLLNFNGGNRPWFEGAGTMPTSVCDGGCKRGTGFGLGGGGTWYVEGGSFTGEKCEGQKPPTTTPKPEKKPPCAAAEGVMTSSTGNVSCVPEGTPDARKPEVEKKSRKETFPDGTQKITDETTTKDPATGATSTQTQSTSTTKSDGTPGMAGAGGTTTGTSNTSGNDSDGDGYGDGECEAGEGRCGDGEGWPGTDVYKKGDKTIQTVLTNFSNGVKATAIGTATTGFFNVTIPGGSCPSWGVDIEFLRTRIEIGSVFCNPTAIQWLDIFGTVLLAVVSVVAFRWAFL